ncbi:MULTISPECIES: hypothetical protein [unclassified Mycolicibacterium]|uniref:hypothetical protein n=1 Tax=unclassified Mycolicibacterium TaxID=2636767 RepID=UPI0012DC0AF1|nr:MULTISPECIES: hypothetical protein [unclassified Mycolicibacterium]MUL84105.1 hypothetical protein [Mycolicibacterium sp. CBMA 329]MUL89829.1 hypothetical protein [Mycolicibacterium sp. CBMA 331]MUM00004.1 hypothetical protein [Mycolicibacterium sp. CBMA 334]MUM29940.1 hypothetical protein [Mycolicibacterium sp. CBMA 295]MUM39344.1 hypothetical protein [Mycolicibacterium sp. CBMA 247]
MTVALALIILISPFAVAAAVSWAAQRSNVLRFRLDLFDIPFNLERGDYETYRAGHDLDAIRTRFEYHPTRPGAGASGERR